MKYDDNFGFSILEELNKTIGETVYYIEKIPHRVTCPTCNGNKKIKATLHLKTGDVEKVVPCNDCLADGNFTAYTDEIKYGKISMIKYNISVDEYNKTAPDINIEIHLNPYKIITELSDIFITKENAERFLEEGNND